MSSPENAVSVKYARMDEFERDLQEKLNAANVRYEESVSGSQIQWSHDCGYFTAVCEIRIDLAEHEVEETPGQIQRRICAILGEKPPDELEEMKALRGYIDNDGNCSSRQQTESTEVEKMTLEERMERDINLTGMEHTLTTDNRQAYPIEAIVVAQSATMEIRKDLTRVKERLSSVLTPAMAESDDMPPENKQNAIEGRSPVMEHLSNLQRLLELLRDEFATLEERLDL